MNSMPSWLDSSPSFQTLRTTWLQAPDHAWQRRIAEHIQRTALDDVTYIPLGQSFPPTAIRTESPLTPK